MRRYTSGHQVPYGFYFSASPLDVCLVGGAGEPLEGKDEASYVRLPTPLVFLLSPVLGGVFVLAFPLIVLGALAYAAGSGVASWFSSEYGHVTQVNWQPAASYFKPPKEEKTEGGEAVSEELAELGKEVDSRRETE